MFRRETLLLLLTAASVYGQSCVITSPTSGQVFTQPQGVQMSVTPTSTPTAYRAVWSINGIRIGQGLVSNADHTSPLDPIEEWRGVPFGILWPVGCMGDGPMSLTVALYDIYTQPAIGNPLAS